jgi:hypothetical protein
MPALKLVEYNTIAVSLLASAARVNILQKLINHKYRGDLACNFSDDFNHYVKEDPTLKSNPILQDGYSSFDEMVESFVKAISFYRESHPG